MSEEQQRRDLGADAPAGPHAPRPRTTTAPAAGASLLVEAARRRDLRSLRTTRWHPTPRLYVAGLVTALVAGLVLTSQWGSGSGTTLVLLAFACGIAATWRRSRARSHSERELRRQAQVEKRLAARLAVLEPEGWHLLHDRVLPGGEHRVPLLLVGPAGVLVVTPTPHAKALTIRGRELWADALPLSPWFATRWWEAEQLGAALFERLGPQWRTVVTPLALASGLPATLTQWGNVAVREPRTAPSAVRTLAAPWSRTQAAYVAGVVDELCPPA